MGKNVTRTETNPDTRLKVEKNEDEKTILSKNMTKLKKIGK